MAEVISNVDLTASTGGGATINNQDISVTKNGVYSADEGYTGLGEVTVSVDNPLKNAKAFVFTNNNNLTITDGIATGFGQKNFLQYPFLCKNSSWELNFCYQYHSITRNESFFSLNNGDVSNQLFVLWFDKNSAKVGLGINNNGTWHDVMSTLTVQNSDVDTTWFYYRLSYNGTDTFTLDISTDGITYEKQFDYTCTLNANGIINIGTDVINSYNYVQGSIDLNNSNLKINGETYNFV